MSTDLGYPTPQELLPQALLAVHRLCIECLCEGGFDLLNEPDLFAVF